MMDQSALNSEFWHAMERLISEAEIVIDRPKNSTHPRFPDLTYPQDYGYLTQTRAMDGDAVDVWIGSRSGSKLDAIICTVDLIKRDVEVKLLIACTEEDQSSIHAFHNNSEYMKGILISRE
mgnify:CR=1 FL=1